MKKIFFLLFFGSFISGQAQLAATIFFPSTGMLDKQQLWNITVTNIGTVSLPVRIEVLITEQNTGQAVMSASTDLIDCPPGTKQLSAGLIGSIQYTSLNPNYRIDPGPTGLLPIGVFNVCYQFQTNWGKQVLQQCEPLTVVPLSPLLLQTPENFTILSNPYPAFTWLPFSSTQSLSNVTYSLKLVEIYPNQSASDAMEKNIPLFAASNLVETNFLSVGGSPVLEKSKQYAWQVSALSDTRDIAKSEVWNFSMAKDVDSTKVLVTPAAFARMRKRGEDEGGYAVFWGDIRIAYTNETSDSTWSVRLQDVSTPASSLITLKHLDSTRMQRGENLIRIPAGQLSQLKDKHIYLLEVFNSRREVWQLKFEYRKEENL